MNTNLKNLFYWFFALFLIPYMTSCSNVTDEEEDDIDVCEKITCSTLRTYCYNHFDMNKDGKVSMSEAAMVNEIKIYNIEAESMKPIQVTSLNGLEVFPNLTRLICNMHTMKSVDVSHLPKLETLTCGESPSMASLNVSQNPNLKILFCNNSSLTSLDVSNNPDLEFLGCRYNQITTLDLHKNEKLKTVFCDNNQLTSLELYMGNALEELYCAHNLLTTLDLRIPSLKKISCDDTVEILR